jgi:hypothetical protein
MTLIDDVEVGSTSHLAGSGGKERANGLSRAAIAADDLADIVLGDAKLDDRVVVPLDLANLNGIGVVDEGTGDGENEIFERHGDTP